MNFYVRKSERNNLVFSTAVTIGLLRCVDGKLGTLIQASKHGTCLEDRLIEVVIVTIIIYFAKILYF